MDPRIVDAVRAFVHAQSSPAAAAVFERERDWLSLPEVQAILGATIEGHRAQPGHARDLAIVQARWDLLDRLLEAGPAAALATFDAAIETVLAFVNAPVERGSVLDVDPARLASREAQWVVADLLLQASDDGTDALILRRWEAAREAARTGKLRQSPLTRGAATVLPAGAASVAPDRADAAAETIAGLEAELAAHGGDADAARRRDLRLALSAAHLECRSGDRAAHLRAALAQLDRLQQELLADRLYAVDAVAREHLLRTYVNLGAAYRASAEFALQERGDGASAVSLVDTAFESYRAAESLAGSEPVTALVAVALHSGLGALSSWRGERRQAVEHYALALQAAREAGDPERAALVDHDLGDELAKMEDELPGARLLAIDHLRAALAFFTPEGWRSHRQQTLRVLGRLLFDMRDWAGADAVLSEAIALGRGILRDAADAGAIRRQVRADAEIFAASAFCQLRLGRVDDAVRRIEQGKARAAALRDGATPGAGGAGEGLDAAGAGAEWRDALFAGMPPGGAVVLSLVTHAGAAAIVVPDGAQRAARDGASSLSATHVVWLDHDSEATLLELAFGPQGWLDSYFRHAPEGDRRWDDAIDRLAGASWRHYAGPIVERLQAIGVPRGAEIAVVPWGRLAMLPLACAWRVVDGDRRYAVEDFAFCQSPSLRLLARARRLACEPARQEPRLLAVADPGGDLPGAIAESERVARLFVAHGAPDPVLLRGARATLVAVRDALPQAGCWLFSCHGRFHWGSPAMSALELAGGDSLSLNALPGIVGALPRVRLAVLTACESGLSDVLRAPDEFDGLPAALLALGVPAVLGTSWPVDDVASAVLVGRFFEHWLSGRPRLGAAQALRLAQLDLMAMPSERYDAGAPPGTTMRDRLFYWGGFALTGA